MVDVIFLDFSKAFDTVPHVILLDELTTMRKGGSRYIGWQTDSAAVSCKEWDLAYLVQWGKKKKKMRPSGAIAPYSFLRRGSWEEGASLLCLETGEWMLENSAKLQKGRFRLDAKNFVTVRMLQHWNKLTSKEVDALCLSDVQEAFR